METYKNSFKKNEDLMLWELHEIRNKLHKKLKGKSVEQINKDALSKFQNWQKNTTKKVA